MSALKLVIIGAGVAGLAAGVYARRSGFETVILEKHIIPGGLSTSWSRKGYLFEGGMHWLTGSSEKLTLNRIWREVGALKENNPIYCRDPIYTLVKKDGKKINLFRDLKKLKTEFLACAPEDRRMINKLCSDVKKFINVHMLVKDIPGLKAKNPTRPKFSEYLKMIPAGTRFLRLMFTSYVDYVSRFKNKELRELLLTAIGTRYNALSFVYTLASFSSGDCGYPKGGSLRLTRNMADTFESLGGKIEYRQTVEKVLVENGKVSGVVANGMKIPADAVIVTQDTRKAVDDLFEIPLKEKWISKMKKKVVSEQNMYIALGVKCELKDYPQCAVFPLEKPFNAGGIEFSHFRINNYSSYENHSPANCSTLTCLLLGNCYDFWKKAKEDGSYKAKKQELAEKFIAELEKFIPEIKGNVEVYDVATPITYERYCNTFEGSWMSVWKTGESGFVFPQKSESVEGLYFAGQRTMMPGGLPITVCSGRKAVQYLCKDTKTVFV